MEVDPPATASSEETSQDDADADQPGPSNAVVSATSASARKKHKKKKKEKERNEKRTKHGSELTYKEMVKLYKQQKRRQTMYRFTRHLGDTVQKLNRGIEAEPNMTPEKIAKEVVDTLEGMDASKIKSSKEFAEDAQMIHKAAQVVASASKDVRAPNRILFNTNLFGERIKAYANKLDPTADPFVAIGQKFKYLLREPPAFDLMRPCIPERHDSAFQAKKERVARVKQQPNTDKLLELHGTTAKEAAEGEVGDTVTKRLGHSRRCLRTILKERRVDSVGYYEFVLHPTSFNESVENAFHLSFLVRDGYVRLKVDETSGMPTVELAPREERAHYQQNDRSQIDTTQNITQLSQDIWEAMVQLLDIREALIPQLTA